MNKKIIFAILIVFVFGIFFMSGGGNDVTVNGVNFHMLDGFDDIEEEDLGDASSYYEAFAYSNTENIEYIKIAVSDFDGDESLLYNSLSNQGYKKKTIDGKDGYGKNFGVRYGYCYVDNDKYVMFDVPLVYGEEGMKYEDILAEIIK